MAVRIRMSVHGRTNYRTFHINLVEGTKKRNAKPLELLGVYDPHVPLGENSKTIQWSVDRIRYWLSVGAQPSKSVVKLLELGGILNSGSPFHPKAHPSTQRALKRSSPVLEALQELKAKEASS